MATSDVIMNIMESGEEMYIKYCPKRKRPLMFPLAPRSKFEDKFPETAETNKEQKEIDQQLQYECEIKVYNTLENLLTNSIVLHGFSYTHNQYSIFVRGHSDVCKKAVQEEEGECDFLVIHENFLAIFEVKAPNLKNTKNPDKTFKRNYKDSKEQRQRTKDLIYGICKRMKITAPDILVFTVFSNFDECDISGYSSYEKLSLEEKASILFMNDITKENMLKIFQWSNLRAVHERLLFILLGIFYYDEVSGSKKIENVDLAKMIENLDSRLGRSKISRVLEKQAPVSSLIVKAPSCLDPFDVPFILKSQNSVLKNEKMKLWINGPAGSGKTMLVMGKVVELLRRPNYNEKVVILLQNETVAKYYEQKLKTKDISSTLFGLHEDKTLLELSKEFKLLIVYFKGHCMKTTATGKNIISSVQMISTILKKNWHIFIDDFHSLTSEMGFNSLKEINEIVFNGLNSNSLTLFWVTYDVLQDGFYTQYTRTCSTMRKVMQSVIDKDCFVSLPTCLRNSRQIAGVLSSLRKLRMDNEKRQKSTDRTSFTIPSEEEFKEFHRYLALDQEIGHYIHGPKPVLFRLESPWSNKEAIIAKTREILKAQLLKLISSNVSIVVSRNKAVIEIETVQFADYSSVRFSSINPRSNDLRPEHPDDEINWKDECEKLLSELNVSSSSEPKCSTFHFDETFSAEWPAVIGIVEFSRQMFSSKNWQSVTVDLSNTDDVMDQLLSKIYITASRARVYCCLILIIRDWCSYIDWKYHADAWKADLKPGDKVSDIINRLDESECSSYNSLVETLSEHMTLKAIYRCETESDRNMPSLYIDD